VHAISALGELAKRIRERVGSFQSTAHEPPETARPAEILTLPPIEPAEAEQPLDPRVAKIISAIPQRRRRQHYQDAA
jgi:hypothetical protein